MMAEADEAACDATPAVPAVAPASDRRPRLAVPMILAAGWGALFSYSLTYLMDDTPRDNVPRDRGVASEAALSDPPGDILGPTGSLAGRPRWRDEGPAITAATEAGPRVVPASLSQDGVPAESNAVRADRAPGARQETFRPNNPRQDNSRQDNPRQDNPRQDNPRQDSGRQESVRPEAPRNETPRRDAPRTEYAGVWGPTAIACGARSRRRGYLPATITDDGAKAGRTLCRFRNGRRDGSAWVVAADCTDRGHSWTSQVRLLVEGDRLTWTSAKGTSAYVRCGRRDG